MTLNETAAAALRDLAARDSKAAFQSAARACGLTRREADLVWRHDGHPPGEEPVLGVRESGAELRAGGDAWLTSTRSVRLEDYE